MATTTAAPVQIKLFHFTRTLFQTTGIYTPQANQNYSLNKRTQLILLCFAHLTMASIAYFLFKAESIGDLAYSYLTSLTVTLCFGFMITITLKIPKILELFDKFDEFIRKRPSTATQMYIELNDKFERISKPVYFGLMGLRILCIIVLPALLTISIHYFVHDSGETYYLAFPVMMPFNWRTPTGYLITLAFEDICMYYAVLYVSTILFISCGSCSLLQCFVKDLTNDLSDLNTIVTATKQQNKSSAKEESVESKINGKKIEGILSKTIQFHSELRQFVNDFNAIQRFIIFEFFVYVLFALCCWIFVMQLELVDHVLGPLELSITLAILFVVFAYLYMFCELGEKVSKQFEMFDDALSQCNWYAFPLKIQRILIIFMANSQDPVFLRGYGNILCTRETFKKTINASFSYFMMLHRING